ncbi:MAG: hypothetical protein EXR64_01235 [Dehalococcoidia bacterium]|nr:hypothetical protein [Dehalococcoidia bacterium]
MRAALAAWGLAEAHVAPALQQRAPHLGAAEWRVAAAPGYLLHRYAALDAEAIAYQHAMLAFLAEDAWPVLVPVRAADGATLVEAEGAPWALFPAPAGAQPPDRPIFVQRRGALLALLHRDLASWSGPDGPEASGAFPRLDDLYAIAVARGHASYDALIARVAAADAARAAQLASLGDRNADMLVRLGYDDLPEVATWGGCTAPHVLYEGDDVTALLDFDGARPDARIADIGASLLVEADRDDGWRVHRWVAGYVAHADPPLTEAEVGMIPTVMTALAVRRAVDALAAAAAGSAVDAPALATVDAAMAAEAAQRDLRRVIRTAAGLPSR